MQVSYEWLSSLVDLSSWTPQRVAQALIDAGIEIEDVVPFAKASHVTTGKVLTKKSIEGSHHLAHVTVDTGHHGVRSIVCGAPNIDVGQVVLVALPGAELAVGTIQASTIRGVASEGMVCSLTEFGIPHKYLTKAQIDGIEVLAPDTPLGRDEILEDLGYLDTILHVKLLANRPDLLSMEAFAHEVAAVCQVALKPQTQEAMWKPHAKASMTLNIQSDKVNQFSLHVLRGVQQTKTPSWMASRLMASGVRPLSFLVDVGNYVMLLTGQPLHFYDVKKLPEPQLVIAPDHPNSFVALDEKTYTLVPDDLAITSGNHVMCLAGVMGAQACAVDEHTTDIAIEAASFQPSSIRKTALRLNLISESSQRFAKGVELSDYQRVLDFTISCIASLTTIDVIEERVTVDRLTYKTTAIPFDPRFINRLLGTSLSEADMLAPLHRLGIQVKEGFATPPRQRVDMHYPADLAEEIIRLIGFHILEKRPMITTIQAGGLNKTQQKRLAIKSFLRMQGVYETLTYTLGDKTHQERFNLLETRRHYVLKNPLSDERRDVRAHGLSSLLDVASYNAARQLTDARFFEWSLMSSPDGDYEALTMVMMGKDVRQRGLRDVPYSFYHGKGMVEAILDVLGIESSRYQWVKEDQKREVLHPGRSARLLLQGQRVGVVGELVNKQKEALGFGKYPVVVVELNASVLLDIKTSTLRLQPLPKYPSVSRDLAIIIRDDVMFQDVVKLIKKAGKSLVQSVDVFDVYRGEHVQVGYQSMALRIKLLDVNKTLTDQDIQTVIETIKEQLQNTLNVEFRA